ncbi:MAG: M20/M25/M40 family metallo-hydrolase [Candidatus Thorarchaeota archaeon]
MYDDMKKMLSQFVAYQSLSSDKSKAPESRKAIEFLSRHLENIGAKTDIIQNESQECNPILFGMLGEDPSKKNILFYSHYDVQPASLEDGWETEPFVLTEKDDGYLYARGVTDDKGPIVATYFAVKELLEENKELPVNIRFLYEGEEESASGGLEQTVNKHISTFGKVDGIVVMDGAWFTDERPSLEYGLRGIAYMGIEISGPKQDKHSGLVGGGVREPMSDLIMLFSRLIDADNKVLVDGFYDSVRPIDDTEQELYDNLEFSFTELLNSLGIDNHIGTDSKEMLMNIWRNPTLTIHGIQGAFSEPGMKTVIPSTVIGKVSMRLVPNQNTEKIIELFTEYVLKEFEKLGSPNTIRVLSLGEGDWWLGDVTNSLFKAGTAAIQEYWHTAPNFARSGGSIPIIPFLEKVFEAPAICVGVGQASDGAHSQDERLRIKNLVGGKEVIKLMLKNLSPL